MAAPSTALSRGSLLLFSQLPPAIPTIWWSKKLWDLGSHPIPVPSLCGGEGSSFSGLNPPYGIVDSESVMSIQSGDPGVLIGHQVNGFTHIWSAEWFVAHSHVNHGFTGKVPSLNHFLLQPGHGDFSFWDQAVVDFEQGFDFISLIPSKHQNWTQTLMSMR